MDLELIGGVSAVVVIVGIIEIVKTVFGLDSKLAPVLAIALGLVASFGWTYYSDTAAYEAVIVGLTVGLSAVGLYSGTKNVKERYNK